jgi:DNA cross-link repair 1A protein
MPIELPRGLPFAVDTWTPASALKRHRFLTHAHRDHLAGITTTSAAGAIYASRLTVLIARHIFPQVTHHQQPTPRLSPPYPFLSI